MGMVVDSETQINHWDAVKGNSVPSRLLYLHLF